MSQLALGIVLGTKSTQKYIVKIEFMNFSIYIFE